MKTKHFGFLLLVATVAVVCLSACGNKQKAEQEVVADVPDSIAEQAVVVDEFKKQGRCQYRDNKSGSKDYRAYP